MGTPVEINPLELASSSGYQISRSVRLRSSASAYFNRTFGTPTNERIWTWSAWVKRGNLGILSSLFNASTGASPAYDGFRFNTSDQLQFFTGGAVTVNLVTTAVYRDPSAWYHIVLSYNATTTTVTIYVNGVAQTTTGTTVSNTTYSFNHASTLHSIGAQVINGVYSAGTYFDGYLTEVNFIDGQALTASSFGTTDSNGIWQPKAYTGTYGTNGFYLKFTDNSAATAAAIGKDYSGNGNNWTPNNISVTAGTTYDSMIDSPTVGAGASNYCTWNPLSSNNFSTPNDGNLKFDIPNVRSCLGTIAMSSGKWYCEMQMSQVGAIVGISPATNTFLSSGSNDAFSNGWGYISNGSKRSSGGDVAYGASWITTDIIGIAYDASAGSLTFYKNGVSQGVAFTGITVPVVFAAYGGSGTTAGTYAYLNCGQRPFSYTPPTGFAALNTYNLPAATINNGATVMAASTYTGTGATQSIVNSGNNAAAVSFKPDFVWIKNRGNTTSHVLQNSIVGAGKSLFSNSTSAESGNAGDLISSFNSNGFTVNDTYLGGSGGGGTDGSGYNYIGWQWQAGQGTTSSNTNGSITSTVSVNQSAGFSIVTYTGTGANATVGHGLGVAPKMIIVKDRSGPVASSNGWAVYHAGASASPATGYLFLNTTAAFTTLSTVWNNTVPTSSVFSIGPASAVNNSNTDNYVAYCWSEVAGYSKFGSYTGNGSADGPFVYLGFRPRWIMVKLTSTAGGNWSIIDTSRNTYNVSNTGLLANASNAEATLADIDVTANGFKVRSTSQNISAETYIFAAFAENPFNISRAR